MAADGGPAMKIEAQVVPRKARRVSQDDSRRKDSDCSGSIDDCFYYCLQLFSVKECYVLL